MTSRQVDPVLENSGRYFVPFGGLIVNLSTGLVIAEVVTLCESVKGEIEALGSRAIPAVGGERV